MKKRVFSILLSLVMVIGLMPSMAWANGTGSEEDSGSETHTNHCVCGEKNSVGNHTTHTNIEWTAWTEAASLPTTEGNYYLTDNVTLDATWECKWTVNLCLNGKTITGANDNDVIKVNSGASLTITDCGTTGKITHDSAATGRGIENNGTLNLWNGSITRNTTRGVGGGVYNDRSGKFTMYGGSITDCTAKAGDNVGGGGVCNTVNSTFAMYGGEITGCKAGRGGGVFNSQGGVFDMTGGSITGCTASEYRSDARDGGGVCNDGTFNMTGGSITNCTADDRGGGVYKDGTFKMSGSPVIKDNVVGGSFDVSGNLTGGTKNNVYLPSGKTITVESDKSLTEGANVGITGTLGQTVVTGTTNATGFTSDNEAYKIVVDGDNLKLADADVTITGVTLLDKVDGSTMSGDNKVYDGKSVAYTGGSMMPSGTGATLNYTWQKKMENGDTYTNIENNAAPSDAGSYKLVVTATKSGTTLGETELNFTITKAAGSGSVEMNSWTYGDTANAPQPISKTNGTGSVTYRYKVKDATNYLSGAPTNAGTYTVEATFAETQNYEAVTATNEFTITPRTLTIGNLTVNDKTYDGTNAATISGTPTLVGLEDCDKEKVPLAGGTPTFTNVNVGNDIHIIFTNFSISGDAAKNYTLTQPTGIKAKISQADLTITGATVTPKTYDGTTDATITNVSFSGLQNNETLKFGEDYTVSNAQYSSANAGDGNSVSFTVTLNDSSVKAKNYKLTSSSGTQTANIGAYAATGNEYTTSTGEWTNEDFTVTAKEGWKLSLTSAAGGSWVSSLTRSDETDSGNLTFYVKNDTTGVISTAITKTYKIDRTAPAITGAENGKTYCAVVTLTITDAHLKTVTLNGNNAALTDNKLTVSPATGTQSVVATDEAGNSKTLTVTVNNAHTWSAWQSNNNDTHTHSCTIAGCDGTETENCSGGEATCTAKAFCTTCDAAYGEKKAENHTGSKIWTKTATTHEQKWRCCNEVTVVSENHEWANGVCAECGYVCLHPGAQDDGSCLTPIVCPECNMTTKAAETAHEWGRYIVTTHATTTSEGIETRYCQHVDCAGNDTRTIAKLTPAPVPVETHSVSGIVKGSNNRPLGGVVVTLVLGDRQIVSATTNADGEYSFEGVEPGVYNLVAQKDDVTMTVKIEVQSADVTVDTIIMPSGKTSSVVEVTSDDEADRIDVAVGGLNEIFTNDTVYTENDRKVVEEQRGSVEIKLTVTRRDEKTTSEEITKALQNNGFVGIRLDLTVEKTVTPQAGEAKTTTISDTVALLETVIRLPDGLQGKSSYTIYRLHDGAVDTLTTSRNTDSEYIEISADKTVITIHARRYSEYVLAYQERRSSHTTTYAITAEDSAHGSVTASSKSAAKGSNVTLTVKPDEGYLLKTLVVLDEDGKEMVLTDKGDGTYTFAMPGGKVTVSAVFVEDYGYERGYATCHKDVTCPIEPYADAENTAWYHDGVHFCIENDLMQGVSSTRFQPNGDVTRAQVVTILWRLEGKPVVDNAIQFEDATIGEWFTEAVRWAASAGIVKGYSDTTFAPDDPIKREQFAAILYRYSQFKGYDVSVGEDTNIMDYDDVSSISSYAVPAIQWAGGSDVMTGVSTFTLNPQGVTSRAQAATMFMRYLFTL